ncbi:glycerol-3-phosphate dehydrogenase/oxidase [Actinocatenispora thailandica]|uniref:glycerol-3-phosphate dehydrogenase/oxidase n=1 Tax=Actinocatenispora thailandica TaxID=227318 RepID=UPI0031D61495
MSTETFRAGAVAREAPRSWLSAARRDRDLARLAAGGTLDVLVVGGGVVGAGVALDAASRGLSVALLERDDLAAGTSSASSKLVHGGLRYLAAGDVPLAWESAAERHILMQTVAPHLVRSLPFVTPYGPGFVSPRGALATVGTHLADLLRRAARTPGHRLPAPRRVVAATAASLAPALRRDGLAGAVQHWDGQLYDDARLVVALARTAALHGAAILTRCAVESIDAGLVTGVDRRGGGRFELRARVVINAAGVWAGRLDPTIRLRPSKGTHLVVRAGTLGLPRAGLNVAVPGEHNRYLIALPEPNGTVYVGLTDDPVDGPVPDRCEPAERDVDYLLGVLSTALDRPLSRADVVGSYAGMRPLVDDGAHPQAGTADLSRRHVVADNGDRLVTVVGGKLTTYRRMAADAVDLAVRAYQLPGDPYGSTDRLPLVGAAPTDRLGTVRAPRRLIARYGTEAPQVAALADADPRLLEPIADGVPVLGVELAFGVLAEGAVDADDLLRRRTRCALVADWYAAAGPAARAAFG